MPWVLDLDGVVWLGNTVIPGAAEAVADLRAAGERVAFVTNNSYGRRADVGAKLAGMGIEPGDDIVTSAVVAAGLVDPGERALVCGGPGITEELQARGVEVVDASDPGASDGRFDVVVVGYHPTFDYHRMDAASLAVRAGARLLATNDDATYPNDTGIHPGGGAILASIVTATGVQPEVAGKPHEPAASLVRERLGDVGTMVGDRPDTDGRFAVALGYRFGLVLSGVTRADDLPTDPPADLVATDLATLVARELEASRSQ
ncbi:MAG TPA: HAD-IIA family hydrolase [Acidimicrobiales bacterium]